MQKYADGVQTGASRAMTTRPRPTLALVVTASDEQPQPDTAHASVDRVARHLTAYALARMDGDLQTAMRHALAVVRASVDQLDDVCSQLDECNRTARSSK